MCYHNEVGRNKHNIFVTIKNKNKTRESTDKNKNQK